MRKPLKPECLAREIARATGLAFVAQAGIDSEGQKWYSLGPSGLLADHTFSIRTTIGWRRLWIDFVPGAFAGALLVDMGNVEADGRIAFQAVLSECVRLGAQIKLEVNDVGLSFDSPKVWAENWKRFSLSLNRGQLDLGTNEGEPDSCIICRWTGLFAAAVVAILPTEQACAPFENDVSGYPEGALTTVQLNRFERDQRNRAAAIAIHGSVCKGCDVDLEDIYGPVASKLVEVHHVTPASEIGAGYAIDPRNDLLPLCPNCHSVVHRRTPPYSLDELRTFLRKP